MQNFLLNDDFEQVVEIARGSYGTVAFKGYSKVHKKFLCIKQMFCDEKESSKQLETGILEKLRGSHQNIINLIYNKYFEDKKTLCIVMELAKHGSLKKQLAEHKQDFTENEIMNIFVQLVEAVNMIHGKKIVHRDIKPDNIFVDSFGCLKLGDFGISRQLSQDKEYTISNKGTASYAAIEQFRFEQQNSSTDVWGIGCVIYELCFKKIAFPGIPQQVYEQLKLIENSEQEDHLQRYKNFKYDDELKELIKGMLRIKKENRLEIEAILSNKFFEQHKERLIKEQKKAFNEFNLGPAFYLQKQLEEVKLDIKYIQQPEIDEKFQEWDFITDIAIPSKQISQALDYTSDQSEIILKDVQLVVHNGCVSFLSENKLENDQKYTNISLFMSIIKVYRHYYKNENRIFDISEKMKNEKIQKFIGNNTRKQAMAMALIFYLEFQDLVSPQNEESFIFNMTISEELKGCLQEIKYWVNIALVNLPKSKYLGTCTKAIQISDNLIKYLKPGKVFRLNNFLTALKGDLVNNDQQNSVFHIYGQTCRDVSMFTSEQQNQSKVIFPIFSEFLVCKMFEQDGKQQVYIREIKTGIGKNIVMWVDDKMKNNYDIINNVQKEEFDQNINFILKSSSALAMAYIESPLFKACMQVCNHFKLISDVIRENEQTEDEKKYAGFYFIINFDIYTKDFNVNQINKMKKIYFCGPKTISDLYQKYEDTKQDSKNVSVFSEKNELNDFLKKK